MTLRGKNKTYKAVSFLAAVVWLGLAGIAGGGESPSDQGVIYLENSMVKLGLSKETGWLSSLVWKDKGVDLLKQKLNLKKVDTQDYLGGLRLYDELTKQWFNDLDKNFTIEDFKADDRAVSFTKDFKGADFTLRETLTLDNDSLNWQVEARKKTDSAPDRSLQVHFCLPVIYGWEVWAPSGKGQFTFDDEAPFQYVYGSTPYGPDTNIIVPIVSHFSKGLDVGYSVIVPFDERIPLTTFRYSSGDKVIYRGCEKEAGDLPQLEVVNSCIGLIRQKVMHTSCRIFFHEGDWRPGLGLAYERFRDCFDPQNKDVFNRAGIFNCGSKDTADSLENYRKMGLQYLEFHGNFPWYGEYFPETVKFRRVMLLEEIFHRSGDKMDPAECWRQDQEMSDAEVKEKFGSNWFDTSRAMTHAAMKKCHEAGVNVYYYINFSDGFMPWADKGFADSVAKNQDGSDKGSGWFMCRLMNPDLAYSFGRHILDNAAKILKEYPEINGFFYDACSHVDIDFGHEDGITVINNRPAYSLSFGYDDVGAAIKKMLLERGMSNFSNRPATIRSMKYTDCMLQEGDDDSEMTLFYAAIAKPFIKLFYRPGEEVTEENLKRTVVLGGFPTVPSADYWGKTDRAAKQLDFYAKLYGRYRPLYELFRRRVLCFEPDPMRLNHGMVGQIFTVKDDYIAGIRSDNINSLDKVEYSAPHTAYFRVRRGYDIGKVQVMYPGDKKPRDTKFTFDGSIITVPLNGYTCCAVVKLLVTGNSGKNITMKSWDKAIKE